MDHSDFDSLFVDSPAAENSQPSDSVTVNSDINGTVMSDTVMDSAMQDMLIKTRFIDNIRKWTHDPFFVNEAFLPELNRVGVERYGELFLLGLHPDLKALMTGSKPPSGESIQNLASSSDKHDNSIGAYLHYIKTADLMSFLYAGGVWADYGMAGREVSHNFAALCTSTSTDHHAFLRQALLNGGKAFFIPAWSILQEHVSDVFHGLTVSLTVRVMELGVAIHMGAMQCKLIHYRSLLNNTRTWSTEPEYVPLCTHSSLNEGDSSKLKTPIERETEFPALFASLEPGLLSAGWTKEKICKFVRRQLFTADEAKVMQEKHAKYFKEYYILRRDNMTGTEMRDYLDRMRTPVDVYQARLRAIGAQPGVWTVARLKEHGFEGYLRQEKLSDNRLNDLKRQIRIVEEKKGYRKAFQSYHKAYKLKRQAAKTQREAVRTQATNQSIISFMSPSTSSSSGSSGHGDSRSSA